MYVHVRRKLTGSYEPVYCVSRYTNGATCYVPMEPSLIQVAFGYFSPREHIFKDKFLQLLSDCTLVGRRLLIKCFSASFSFFHWWLLLIIYYFPSSTLWCSYKRNDFDMKFNEHGREKGLKGCASQHRISKVQRIFCIMRRVTSGWLSGRVPWNVPVFNQHWWRITRYNSTRRVLIRPQNATVARHIRRRSRVAAARSPQPVVT